MIVSTAIRDVAKQAFHLNAYRLSLLNASLPLVAKHDQQKQTMRCQLSTNPLTTYFNPSKLTARLDV